LVNADSEYAILQKGHLYRPGFASVEELKLKLEVVVVLVGFLKESQIEGVERVATK
jgi:hypothetical protein